MMKRIYWSTEIDNGVWNGNCDTLVSDGGRVATVPTKLKQDWFGAMGLADGDSALRAGWALVMFMGRMSGPCWNIKVVIPNINQNHAVFPMVRQYIANTFRQLYGLFGKKKYYLLPNLDIQLYCNETQKIYKIEDCFFWIKTGHFCKNGLTQLTDIMDNEIHVED